MSNALSFVLGMQAGQFAQAVDSSEKKLGSLLSTAAKIAGITALTEGMTSAARRLMDVVGGVGQAFERGADLQRLHNRTGQSVKDLFLLQKGFGAVGLQADSVGEMIFHLQKSLTGVSEVGEDTSVAFSLLGLNMAQLRKENAGAAIQDIAKAFRQLDPSQAAGFASKLFGRGQGSNFLQLARDSQAFSAALRDNAAAAAQMDRNAAAFNQIEISLTRIKGKANNFFSGVAEGVAPAVQAVLDMINKIDLSKIGSQLGTVLGGFAGALKEGKISEAIGDTISAGFEMAIAMAPAIFAKLGEILLRVFQTPLEYFSAAMEYVIEKVTYEFTGGKFAGALSAINPAIGATAAAILGKGGAPAAPDWQTIVARQKNQGLRFNVGAGEFGMSDITASANDAWKTGAAKAGGIWDNLIGSMKKFQTALPPASGSSGSSVAATVFAGPVKNFEAAAFEKMGARLGGSNAPTILSDHARQTANNTARMVVILQDLSHQFSNHPPGPAHPNHNM